MTAAEKQSPFGPATALFALSLLLYVLTAAQTVLGGDNGEFATVAARGGVPHPSGYPLYALYLRAMSWLPGVAAHAAALATCVIGGAAVTMVYHAGRAWGAAVFGASLAASGFAFARIPWLMATHAEVFALHALLAASIIMASGPVSPVRGLRRVGVLALLAGFGISNNHSLVTLAPLGLWGAILGVREVQAAGESAVRAWAKGLGLGIAALAVGLLPYLSLMAQADNEIWAWGNTGSWSGLLHHFLRRDYGTFSLAISDNGATAFQHVAALLQTLTSELHGVLWIVVLAGTAHGLFRAPRPRCIDAAVYLVTWLLCGPIFIARFNLPLTGLSEHVVERFYLLPFTLLCVPLAVGWDQLLRRRANDLYVLLPLAVAIACLGVFRHLDQVREHHAPYMEEYLVNTLRSMPPDGVLLGRGDHEVFGFLYVQEVLGERQDVTYLNAPLLAYDWYREHAEARLGFALQGANEERIDSLLVASSILMNGRPLAMTQAVGDRIPQVLPTYPVGTLVRVLPPDARLPSPPELEAEHTRLMRHYDVSERLPWDPTGWGAYVYQNYARPWRSLADIYTAMGLDEDAERCRTHADRLTPWDSPEEIP